MKPLLTKDLTVFLKRFHHFKNGHFKHFEVLSPTQFKVILTGQDDSRAFDWVSVEFELTGASSANLLENSKLSLIDMEDGINISHNGTDFAFELYNSTFFIECKTIKYQEGAF